MPRRAVVVVLATAAALGPSVGLAQQRPPAAPPARPPATAPATPTAGAAGAEPGEIKLDESTTLRAAALEAQMSAVLANFALLQRQAQDLQTQMARMLEDRKKLIEDAGKKVNVDVKNANEWTFDNKGQRYLRARPAPAR
jgi:hypothetical protein